MAYDVRLFSSPRISTAIPNNHLVRLPFFDEIFVPKDLLPEGVVL